MAQEVALLSLGAKWFRFFIVLCVITSLPIISIGQDTRDLSSKLSGAIAKSGRKTVAVVDFTDLQGCVTEFGRFLAEQLSLELATSSNQFEVIDRTNLKTLLQEHKLASTGIIDPQTARRVGEIAGVQALVTGTVTPLGDNVRLSVKVLDAQTAKIVGGVAADLPRSKPVDDLLRRGISGGCQATSPLGGTAVTNGGTQESDDNSHASAGPPQPVAKPVTIDVNGIVSDFSFTFRMCLKTEDRVECSGHITNNAAGSFGLGVDEQESYFVDNMGNQVRGLVSRFGSGRLHEGQVFAPGIPMTFSISANGVFKDASTISLYLVTNRGNGVLKSFPLQTK
jgi:TolB-like protein